LKVEGLTVVVAAAVVVGASVAGTVVRTVVIGAFVGKAVTEHIGTLAAAQTVA
jgi:hypothetical protein